MRVGTFNIRTGLGCDGFNSWPFRRRATAAAIKAVDADVIGLQEVHGFQRRYLERQAPGWRWFGLGRSGRNSGEQCPITVTNPELDVVTHQTRWYGPPPALPGTQLPGASFPRIATLVRCRGRLDGTEFDVINTHLDEHIDANRLTSVRQLVAWIDQAVPTVVLGDFNAEPSNAAVLGPLADAGFEMADVTGGTSHGFTGTADGSQIDHIFLSRHWAVEDCAIVRENYGRLASDHWPVRATMRLTGTL